MSHSIDQVIEKAGNDIADMIRQLAAQMEAIKTQVSQDEMLQKAIQQALDRNDIQLDAREMAQLKEQIKEDIAIKRALGGEGVSSAEIGERATEIRTVGDAWRADKARAGIPPGLNLKESQGSIRTK